MAIQQGMLGLAGIGQNQEDLVAKIRAEQQARNQRMTQGLGKWAGLTQAGMESAQQFGGALGVQDPRLQRNSQVIAARDAVRAKGITDPQQQVEELAKELSARGLYEEADRALQNLRGLQKEARTEKMEERKMAVQEGELSLRKEAEARAGRLTDAQINEIKARIGQGNFDVQFSKNSVTGAIERVYRVNKRTGQIEDITESVIGKTETPTGDGKKKGLTDEEVRALMSRGAKPASGQMSDIPGA